MNRTGAPLTLMIPAEPNPCSTRAATRQRQRVRQAAGQGHHGEHHESVKINPAVASNIAERRKRQQRHCHRQLDKH